MSLLVAASDPSQAADAVTVAAYGAVALALVSSAAVGAVVAAAAPGTRWAGCCSGSGWRSP
jgi:hypothetical protein